MFDAWAYGIPCVVTPVGGLPDIVIDGENALVFPVDDVDMLSSQLKKMSRLHAFCFYHLNF